MGFFVMQAEPATHERAQEPAPTSANAPLATLPVEKLKRLRASVLHARMRMRPFREKRVELIREFVGFNYSTEGSKAPVPVNLLDLALVIYLQNLSAKTPKVLAGTQHMDLKPQALLLEMAINHLLPKINFSESMRRVVMDALICVGVLKVGLEPSQDAEARDGYLHDPGQPFADVIDFDDLVFDVYAKRWDQIQFIGNRYRVPLDVAKQSALYSKDVRSKLQATHFYTNNMDGDPKVETIGQGLVGEREMYEELVELIDVWLPRENVLITMSAEQELEAPLRVVKWKGPQGGPYLLLGYCEVPGNLMPKAPAMNWMELHLLANNLFRKLGRQAERSKTVAGVMDGGEKDGERIIKSNDGDMIKMDQPDRVKEFKFGGADPNNLALFLKVEDVFSRQAGNLDTLGGLSPQAPTLGQEELLSAGSSKKMQDMQQRTVEFVKRVIQQIAWYLWHDPLIKLPLVYQHPAGVNIPMTFDAADKKGDFWQYDIDIDPYSMQEQSPGARLQALMNVIMQMIVPMLPQIQQQGGQVDFQLLMETIAKLGNMPEINQLLKFQSPPQTPQDPQMSAPPQKGAPPNPVTQHTSVRVNRNGATRAGKTNAMIQQLSGLNQQPAEQAMMGRSVA